MTDVLKRKLGASRAPKKSGGVTIEALLRKTMPRDADAVLSLDIAVRSFAVAMMDSADLRDSIGPCDLTFLLEAKDGACGLAILDLSLSAAVVEVQVSGRVSKQPPPERPPTRTDGIVAGEIVDRWLESGEAAAAGAGLDGAWPLSGYERTAVPINRREAELLLEPVEFRVLEISLSLGAGDRVGLLRLVAPRLTPLLAQQENTTTARVRGHLPELPVALRAVLTNLPLGMSEVRALAQDNVLPLPDGCLNRVRLETRDGRLVEEVRLGQLDGKKAIRLIETAENTSGPVALPLPTAMPAMTGGVAEPPELPSADPLPANEPDLPELPELPDLP